jgi:putative transcriptional regulator
VSNVRQSNEQIRASKGGIDHARVAATTEADIERWKRADGIDDATLGPARYVGVGPDVKALRERLGLSQEVFSARFGLAVRTVQEWEQRRRVPEGSARTLLRVIEHDPAAVERALADTEPDRGPR